MSPILSQFRRNLSTCAAAICAVMIAYVFALVVTPTFAADDPDVIVVPSRKKAKPKVARKFPGSKFNLHILATESFVNRLIARTNSENGQVTDFVLGANVSGWQTTDTKLMVNFTPNKKYGQVDFTVSGNTQSETIGDTGIAQISTLGQHSFVATKPAYFDGKQFLTRRATSKVNANNINRGVVTAFSGLPVIGELADRRAQRKVSESKTQTEMIAAQRVSDRINPRLDAEVDTTLTDINKLVARLTTKWLTPQNLEPDAVYSTTSNDFFRYSASVRGETLPVDTPIPTDRPHGKSLSIYVHESLFEQLVSRMKLNGMEVPMDVLQALLGRMSGKASDSADTTDQSAAISYSLVFDKQRPAFVSLADGNMKLNLRFALKPVLPSAVLENQADDERKEILADATAFPMQSVSIPISLSTRQQMVAINPGPVTVMAARQPTSAADDGETEPVTDFTSKLIQMALQRKLQSLELPGKFDLPLESDRKVSLTVSKAVTKNGWLMLAID